MSDVLGKNVGHVVQNVGHVRMSDDFSYTLVLLLVTSIRQIETFLIFKSSVPFFASDLFASDLVQHNKYVCRIINLYQTFVRILLR